MTIIFKAKTTEGYSMKICTELLQNNIKTACFEIDEAGIRLRMMDHHRRVLIDLDLQSENFTLYKFKNPEKMFIGINMSHFHKMVKAIKKKDSMVLFIDDERPTDLGIKVVPKENNRVTTSYIKIQDIQNLDIDIPLNYGKPVIVPSAEYQKLCKDMNNIGTTINIVSKGFYVRFLCNAGSVYSREVVFGEIGDEDDETETITDQTEYNEDFDIEQLCRIAKISGLSSNMQMFPKEGLPLFFRSNIGSLGKISIFIKCKKQIEAENLNIDPETEE
jgi:proliferating cell nuclear antigen